MDRRRALKLLGAGALATAGGLAAAVFRGKLAVQGTVPVVVIGSGATGIASALTLLEAGLPVLMLESGPYPQEPHPKDVKEGAPDEPFETADHQQFRWFRVRTAGGKMTRWGRHCPRFSPLDFHELGA